MRLDYELLHWGTPSSHVEDMQWPSNEPGVLGARIRAISYVTRKGSAQVFEHVFGDTEDGMARDYVQPRILWLDGRPGRKSGATCHAPRELVALGRLVDVELADGDRLHPVAHWICTTPTAQGRGGSVIIASRFRPLFAVEQVQWRGDFAPFITEHGIVA